MAAGRIDEGVFLDVHGVEQWVTLRGDDRENPILFVVSGPIYVGTDAGVIYSIHYRRCRREKQFRTRDSEVGLA